MIIIPTRAFIRRRRIRAPRAVATAPTLVSAFYSEGEWVELGFDVAIDIAGLQPGEIVVDDGLLSGASYAGTSGATLTNAQTVRIPLAPTGVSEQAVTRLTAGAGNGIVPSGGGAMWAGASGLELPWPS
jgi:hypothetical protein